MTIDRYSASRVRRDFWRSPFQRILPGSRRMVACPRVRISRRNPSSTAARFVRDRLLLIACRIRRSSISMLVRIPLTLSCVRISHSCVSHLSLRTLGSRSVWNSSPPAHGSETWAIPSLCRTTPSATSEHWIFTAATKSGHIEKSTLKKQHKGVFKTLKEEAETNDEKPVRPFVRYDLRHTFLTRLENRAAMSGRWLESLDTATFRR